MSKINNNSITCSSPYKLAFSLSVIYGSFTLGFYVAIQGPTLMDLIDILHVNNDIMSYSLAFASLAYSLGGLMSGFLFNYVDRQILIPGYYVVFGTANIITPYVSNYYMFTLLTVIKMMCAGGTDCGANVWILDMWPGKDAWLQALHFCFAVGCALGPLVVEPFLSAGEHSTSELEARLKDNNGHTLINDQSTESRIYIPYGVSGATSLLAAAILFNLHFKETKWRKEQEAKLRPVLNQKQLAASGEHILMNSVQHPAAIEAGLATTAPVATITGPQTLAPPAQPQPVTVTIVTSSDQPNQPPPTNQPPSHSTPDAQAPQQQQQQQPQQQATPPSHPQHVQLQMIDSQQKSASASALTSIKFTSKAKKQPDGRRSYYLIFAIALCALSLSFYCGIEITSMNYLATFAVNIDLQLPKSTAALMSSALTISFAVGRLLGIWIAAYMRPHKLFYLCSGVMATGNICILLFANHNETFLWYSICLFGIGCGPMFASIVSFYDDRISKVTNKVSGIFILGSMFNVALNSLIIGHYIIDNALVLIVCNLIGSMFLLFLFMSLHMLTRVKKNQRKRKFHLQQKEAHKKLDGGAGGGGEKEKEQQQQQQLQPLVAVSGTPGATTRAAALHDGQQDDQEEGEGEGGGDESESGGGQSSKDSSAISGTGNNSPNEQLDVSSASTKTPKSVIISRSSVADNSNGSNEEPEEHDKLLADNPLSAATLQAATNNGTTTSSVTNNNNSNSSNSANQQTVNA